MVDIVDAGDNRRNSYAPANRHVAITNSDTDDLPFLTRGIYTGSGGDITIVTKDGTAVLYAGTAAGTIIPIAARRVNNTGTTPTDLVALG